ncbi:MAG: type I DNA topoisomerase, partial [Clostridiales bacterium]|nr:type I DNA topoisomerase [Clostridiales bacterium]
MPAKISEQKKQKGQKEPKNLVIVESPAKAKTLKKFLGSSYKIEASMGHVRDLPKSEMGVDIANNFEPKYITIRGKGELLAKLRKAAKDADTIYLATDPDREGEAISWHLTHALKLNDKNTKRITFNEITKTAVKNSITEARSIDMSLVDAQQARRVLDRIVGYKISPLLWSKVKKGLSAGRVQSVALKIICDRDAEITNFVPVEYWTVSAKLSNKKNARFIAKYPKELHNKEETDALIAKCKDNPFVVAEIKRGERTRKPRPPFTTSVLQQEASKQLNFASKKTMMIAQQLYEGVDVAGHGSIGLVSYIRTDSVRISDEASDAARKFIKENYGEKYSSLTKPEYKTKGRAQDAHEAIRPTYIDLTPAVVESSLTKEQYKLYSLIWTRFIASQMTPALYATVNAKINCGDEIFKASGSTLLFEGYKIADKS